MDGQDKLYDLLAELVFIADISDNETKIKDFFHGFTEVYSSGEYRHSYYEISSYLDNLNPDERDSLEGNIEQILLFSSSQDTHSNTTKSLAKLLDHVSLERLRMARIEKIKYVGNKISQQMNQTKDEITAKRKEMEEIDQKINSIHSETISILGIFAGLVIGFATSFQLLSNSLSNLNDVLISKLLIFVSVVGIILFNCLFFLMFAVARVSGRSLAMKCKRENCDKCPYDKKCKSTIGQFFRKYPYVLWFNIAMVIIILAGIGFKLFF